MIKVDLAKCTGCKLCESACSFYHTGKINNRLSRIKVLNIYETGIDGPVVCNQCGERYCMNCPNDALTIGQYGQIIVSPTVCGLCAACEKNCPIGAIELFNDITYVCDLCGGRPKCIEACTEDAITWDVEGEVIISNEEFKKEAKKKNPVQKRFIYVSKQGAEIRKKWGKAHA